MEIPKEKRLEYFLEGLRSGKEIAVMAQDLGVLPNSLYAYKSGLVFFGLLDGVIKENPNCFTSKEDAQKKQKFLDDYLLEHWASTPLREIFKATGFKSRVVLENFIRRRRKSGVPIPERDFNERQRSMDDYFMAHWESTPMEEITRDTGKSYKVARTYVRRARVRGVPIPERKYIVHNAFTADKEWQKKHKEKAQKSSQSETLPIKTKEKKIGKAKTKKVQNNSPARVEKESLTEAPSVLMAPPAVSPPPIQTPPIITREPVIIGEVKDGEIIPRGPNALDNPDEPGSKVQMPDFDKLYGKLDPPKNSEKDKRPHEMHRMTMDDLARISRIRREKTEEEIEDEAQELRDRIKESQQE